MLLLHFHYVTAVLLSPLSRVSRPVRSASRGQPAMVDAHSLFRAQGGPLLMGLDSTVKARAVPR